jgi:hypothetical protein
MSRLSLLELNPPRDDEDVTPVFPDLDDEVILDD